MKRGTRILISLACGVLAAACAYLYAADVRAEAEGVREELLAQYGGDTVAVCVATREIEPGETLVESDVSLEDWVPSLLPTDAETSVRDVAGRQVTSRVPEGAVLCSAYFERHDDALEVPAGMVAVSVPPAEEHAVGGAVMPGDRVDVYVSQGGVADRLCNAQVIDTSARVAEAEGAAVTWVTLAVSPDRVSEVLAATAVGSVSLTLPGASLEAQDGGVAQ